MTISLIVAMSRNGVIGRGNDIPWRIPGEQKRFRELTVGNTVIMGRRTFESIGHPLPDRLTVILTRCADYQAGTSGHDGAMTGCRVAPDLETAIGLARGEIFISGGASVYAEALPRADRIYLTTVHRDFEGDVRFPRFSEEEFVEVSREEVDATIPYRFSVYERARRRVTSAS